MPDMQYEREEVVEWPEPGWVSTLAKQQRRIEALEARVAELERKIAEMEKNATVSRCHPA